MTASFGLTLTLAAILDVDGLPALPVLAVGFLAPNADRIWRDLRRLRRERATRALEGPSENPSEREPARAE